MCKLLTNLDFYSFDPQHVITKLPQDLSSKSSSLGVISGAISSAVISFSGFLEKTPTNQKQFSAMMDHLTLWLPSSFQNSIRQLKKASSIAFADRRLLQDSTTELFKANLAKGERERKRKQDGERATYGNAFGLVLTESMAESQRMEEEQKVQKVLVKRKQPRHEKSTPPPRGR